MRTWRTIEIYHDKGLASNSGTETFALPRTHMIGDLWLVVRATTGATNNVCDAEEYNGIQDQMDKITIKSGSKTFKSMTGDMTRLIAAIADGRLAPATKDQGAGVVNETVFPIHFGIEPQDEDVILPAPLLDSLDMVLEYNFNENTTDGWAASGYKFDLYAQVLEPTADLEDKMILVQEKKQDVTFSAAGDTPFDLTLDERRLLRKVYVEAYVAGSAEGVVCGDIELKADNEQVVKADWEQIQFQNAMDHKLVYHDHIKTLAEGATDEYQSKIPDVYATYEGPGGAETTTNIGIGRSGDKITFAQAVTADVGDLFMYSDVLPAVAFVDFDRDNSLRRLQPQGIRDLDLVLNELATGAGSIYEESLQKIW